jgi:hypothetical protein
MLVLSSTVVSSYYTCHTDDRYCPGYYWYPLACTYVLVYEGHTQKNGAVSKDIKHLFPILHGHNIYCQQRELSMFLMLYQQFASHAYYGAAGPVSNMASQQEKAFCVLRFEVSRSVFTVQRELRARLKKHFLVWCVFSTVHETQAALLLRTPDNNLESSCVRMCVCVCVCVCIYIYIYIYI